MRVCIYIYIYNCIGRDVLLILSLSRLLFRDRGGRRPRRAAWATPPRRTSAEPLVCFFFEGWLRNRGSAEGGEPYLALTLASKEAILNCAGVMTASCTDPSEPLVCCYSVIAAMSLLFVLHFELLGATPSHRTSAETTPLQRLLVAVIYIYIYICIYTYIYIYIYVASSV